MSLVSKWVIEPGWEPFLRRHRLDSLDRLYAACTGTVAARSGASEVRCLELTEPAGTRTLFIKTYWFDTFQRRFKGALRGTFLGRSKVRCEFGNLKRLLAWGLDAPRPVAWGEERTRGWLRRSVLVTEGVPDAITLDFWFLAIAPSLDPRRRREQVRSLLRALAGCVARMHDRRFAHGDLFWRNIILRRGSMDHFYLIDSHHGHVWMPWQSRRSRAMDLAALDAVAPSFLSRSQRLRFLLEYLGQTRLTDPARRLVRDILRQAEPLRVPQDLRLPRRAAAIMAASLPHLPL